MVELIETSWSRGRGVLSLYAPGMLFSIVLALAATSISAGYGGPAILFALLLGMTFNFITEDRRYEPGLDLASRNVLRIGVALLGARITAAQITALGGTTLAGVAATVALTIAFGVFAAWAGGMTRRFGILTGGAVAICGASAAAAIAAVLPRDETHERDTAFTIVGVTALATIAMVLYPVVAKLFNLNHVESGVFLGGTIHDVAQVLGAGYSVSPETGDVAAIVKLTRVALLLPAVIAISVFEGRARKGAAGSDGRSIIPGFLIAFAGIVMLNSAGLLPKEAQSLMSDASRWCIVIAIAGLGVKTSLAQLAKVGYQAFALMAAETVFITCLVMALVRLG